MHEYLGVAVDYSLLGKVAFTMFEYLKDIISEALEESKPSRCTHPCNKEDSLLINAKRVDPFHRLVTILLSARKRARPDTQLTVAFLCVRVKA